MNLEEKKKIKTKNSENGLNSFDECGKCQHKCAILKRVYGVNYVKTIKLFSNSSNCAEYLNSLNSLFFISHSLFRSFNSFSLSLQLFLFYFLLRVFVVIVDCFAYLERKQMKCKKQIIFRRKKNVFL